MRPKGAVIVESKPREFHPVAELFPLIEGQEFQDLVEDIRKNGLQVPIWTVLDGRIIDGRNRYRACMEAGVDPRFQVWLDTGKQSLIQFVVSLNVHRRHLNEAQRAMIAAKIANSAGGGYRRSDEREADDRVNVHGDEITNDQAAELLNVSRSSVSHARDIRKKGAKELVEATESGRVSLRAARQIAEKPKEEQRDIVERARVVRGRRLVLPPGGTENEGTVAVATRPAKERIKLSISGENPVVAASELMEAMDHDFLERVVEELNGILSRARAAVERGMRPARKD